jgi:hypothetical protein
MGKAEEPERVLGVGDDLTPQRAGMRGLNYALGLMLYALSECSRDSEDARGTLAYAVAIGEVPTEMMECLAASVEEIYAGADSILHGLHIAEETARSYNKMISAWHQKGERK